MSKSNTPNLPIETARAAQRGESWAVMEVVERLEPTIYAAIHRSTNSNPDTVEDLAQDARLTILEAIPSWDEAKGVPIGAFITKRAVGQVKDNVSRYLPGPKLSASSLKRYNRSLLETPTYAEARDYAKEELQLGADLWDSAHAALGRAEGESVDVDNMEATDNGPSQEYRLAESLVDELPSTEATVLRLLYGIGDHGPMTEQEAAHFLNISQPSVSRRKARAIRRIQANQGVNQ